MIRCFQRNSSANQLAGNFCYILTPKNEMCKTYLFLYGKTTFCMVLILDCNSEHGVHICSKLGVSIRLHRQIRQKFGKDLFYFMHAQHVLTYHLTVTLCLTWDTN